MQLDARTLPAGGTLEADLCIVGAGPTGLSLAAEFADSGTTVVVLESGAWNDDLATQSLNSAAVDGDPHEGLQKSRHRQVGGTACLWNMPLQPAMGAKYVPLDPLDLRGEHGRPRWPIPFSELVPYYGRAQAVAGIGRFEYESAPWGLPDSPVPGDHPSLESRIYQFGTSDRFCRHLADVVSKAPNLTLCSSATAARLQWRNQTVEAVGAVTSRGGRLTIRARRLVLAAGGVENARILLAESSAGKLADTSGWLGRGFMEHPRDYSIVLSSTSRRFFERLEFFDTHVREGTTVGGRIAIREEAILRHELPNASITLMPLARTLRPFHWRLESLAWRRLGWKLYWPPGYGWSRLPSIARRFDGFQLLINLEEFPSPDNRLMLDTESDAMGVRRVRLQRRWQTGDAQRLGRLRDVVTRSLEEIGLGPLAIGPAVPPDPNSHHHLGTTRMGDDPTTGVTDASGRVFGSENLFVVGGSLFPTAGYANPTLTAIALALRLADRIKSSG
jgi:choline dehydrogenase-like flavoprotein